MIKMKVKLNLTIDDRLLDRIKRYAANRQMSVSELAENYFKNLIKPAKNETIIDLVDKLDKPSVVAKRNLKKAFYEDQAEKYGF